MFVNCCLYNLSSLLSPLATMGIKENVIDDNSGTENDGW